MQTRILPILIILSLFSVGVFGFLGLGMMDHGGRSICPISLMSGGLCPSAGNTLAVASHHVSGLQYFTQSIIGIGGSLLVLFALLAFVLLFFSKLSQEASAQQYFLYEAYHKSIESHFIPGRKFLSWLALHHKRDPHALLWVHDIA